ncbi:SRPBCC family protein [Mycolicibacterium bacteremicum]|uniref:ATPase n=1 Tax=Mycolicibacterium bacteremicum TaxID=564198 RepID=A0A1W9Z4T1_MYCBA|nr:SRPBCC domain-containing protein [Mycolicibacterium bacteremicum]MCV7433655.1 SRPBCC domain-containing protein [Mycolicibacterium bacteremicum]ORA07294.1 ATPase [Mycolicibacterium bacteremicum]
MTEVPAVRVQRIMPAVPEDVFDEWLDPESLREWMCPRPTRCVEVTVQPEVGGIFRFDVDDDGVSVLITGHFLVVDRPRLLKFTWVNSYWADPTAASVVAVTFEPLPDDRTLMSIDHTMLPPDEYQNFHSGWIKTADQLADLLSERRSGSTGGSVPR